MPDPEPPLPKLSIIITAYQDGAAIAALAEEISAGMSAAKIAWEAIWIDDGSSDDTLAQVKKLPAPHRYLSFHQNCGQSAGYRVGAEAARGQWLATLDGDGQNDPADLPRLLAEAEIHGVDLVQGFRVNRQDRWLRRMSAWFANRVRNWATGVKVVDAGCASRVVRRERFLQIPFFHGNYYFFAVFIVLSGGVFREIPTNHRPRRHGRGNYGIRNRLIPGFMDLIGVCWLMRRHRQWRIDEESAVKRR